MSYWARFCSGPRTLFSSRPLPIGMACGDGGEFVADGVVDVVVDVEALERRAGLAGVDERAPEQALGDGLGVGVGQDDAGVVAAEFQGEALDGVRGGLMIALPVAVEPVNMILPMAGWFESARADVAAAGDDGQQALGQFLVDDFDQCQDAAAGCTRRV